MNLPRFPIFIPSKGRADICMTMKALDQLGVPYRVVVEQQEFDAYAAALGASRLLVLDPRYQVEYDACDDLGMTRSKGSGPARNFIWDKAVAEGHAFHWIMDDNIREFYRLNRNRIYRMGDGSAFWIMEEFVLRYRNVAMAGPAYEMFAPRRQKAPPIVLNTRIFSCNLIRSDVPFRWRGRYNEDADLSIRMLKAGWCTVEFFAFLQKKLRTQMMKGGNTDTIYTQGTRDKSEMLKRLHPDVVSLIWKYGRHHHHIDIRPFQRNKLLRRDDLTIQEGNNEFGMALVRVEGDSSRGSTRGQAPSPAAS